MLMVVKASLRKKEKSKERAKRASERKEKSKKKNHEKVVCGFEIYCVVGLW